MGNLSANEKIINEAKKNTVKCKKCGRGTIFYPTAIHKKKICTWCGQAIYANDNLEFKDRLKKVMDNERNL